MYLFLTEFVKLPATFIHVMIFLLIMQIGRLCSSVETKGRLEQESGGYEGMDCHYLLDQGTLMDGWKCLIYRYTILSCHIVKCALHTCEQALIVVTQPHPELPDGNSKTVQTLMQLHRKPHSPLNGLASVTPILPSSPR